MNYGYHGDRRNVQNGYPGYFPQGGGYVQNGFPGLIPEGQFVHVIHANRPGRHQGVHAAPAVNANTLAILFAVLMLFMMVYSCPSCFKLLLPLLVFCLIIMGLRMSPAFRQLQHQAVAHPVAARGIHRHAEPMFDIPGHTGPRMHMPPEMQFTTRGPPQGHRIPPALSDREFERLDYEALGELDNNNGPTSASMGQEQINALPVHRYQQPRQGAGSSEECNCTICLEEINSGELVRTLPCLHKFHVNCIDPWLRQYGTCPTCKSSARG